MCWQSSGKAAVALVKLQSAVHSTFSWGRGTCHCPVYSSTNCTKERKHENAILHTYNRSFKDSCIAAERIHNCYIDHLYICTDACKSFLVYWMCIDLLRHGRGLSLHSKNVPASNSSLIKDLSILPVLLIEWKEAIRLVLWGYSGFLPQFKGMHTKTDRKLKFASRSEHLPLCAHYLSISMKVNIADL